MKKLDNIDIKIINILQQNARATLKDIARQVFLTSPSVAARIERLEDEGIIEGYHAQINPMLLDYHIKAFINLEVEPSQKVKFYPFIKAIPNVVECNCVTGDYSMLIEVLFQSTMELDHFINELQQFGRTKTQIVFSTSVEQRAVPVQPSVRRSSHTQPDEDDTQPTIAEFG
jgi:Lrp/AsnC family leucine-responsive transcriptional regulator